MPTTAELYDKDFVRWTEEQARALRSDAGTGADSSLDWEHVAEEIESLGISYRRQLGSRIGTIIEHLLKLENSPGRRPRREWVETSICERAHADNLLDGSPSLRRELPEIVSEELRRTKKLSLALLDVRQEATPAVKAAVKDAEYGPDQVLGDWLPPERE